MRLLVTIAVAVLLLSGCAGSVDSCADYADQVGDLLSRDAPGPEIERFLENTEEQVARLIAANPEEAEACVGAVLEATFAIGFAELESLLDG